MKKLIIFIIFLFIFASIYVNAEIIINEIMYDPSGADTDHEWIEIYNNIPESINLENWNFFENNQNHRLSLAQGDDMVLGIGEYAVIVQDSDTFLQDYEGHEGMVLDSSFSLSNAGEYIALRTSEGEISDEVEYSADWGGINGISLEVINPNFDNNVQFNWDSSLERGGTPGRQNSIYIERKTYSKLLRGGIWNLISFNIKLFDNRSESVFNSLENLIMVKDEHGNFYQPGNMESTLEEVDIKDSYYIKIQGRNDYLELEGFEPNLNDYIFIFNANQWNWFSYMLDEGRDIEEVFEENINDIFLIKDGDGKFWAPRYNYNGIGNMIPGMGYMILSINRFEFRYNN